MMLQNIHIPVLSFPLLFTLFIPRYKCTTMQETKLENCKLFLRVITEQEHAQF